MKNRGISLIALVITIAVIILLAGTVILNLNDNNPANNARISSINQMKDTIESSISVYLSNAYTETYLRYSREELLLGSLANTAKYAIVDGYTCTITENGTTKTLYRLDVDKVNNELRVELDSPEKSVYKWYVDSSAYVYLVYNSENAMPDYLKKEKEKGKDLDYITYANEGSIVEGTIATRLSNDNIGDYVEIGTSMVKGNTIGSSEQAKSDWRVLFVQDSKVYLILADYLPNTLSTAINSKTHFAQEAGLNTTGNYAVYSTNSRNSLINNGLSKKDNWVDLSNSKSINVYGSPTVEHIRKSYSVTNYDFNYATSSSIVIGGNSSLLFPHSAGYNSINGYWLSTSASEDDYVWYVDATGFIKKDKKYSATDMAIRPVVVLPTTTTVTKNENGVWVVG